MNPLPASNSVDLDDDDRAIGRVLSRREVLGLLGSVGAAAIVAACSPAAVSTASLLASASPAASRAATSASPSSVPTAAASASAASTASTARTPAATAARTVAASATAAAPTTAATTASAPAAVAAVPACVVVPALTEGPYFVNEKLKRSDIRSDPTSGHAQDGVPLVLTFAVAKVSGGACTAYEGAVVDVWHCNALGVYSDVQGNNERWLRGYQVTDANGLATFTTIYPGWYQGRTVHIHFKIRTSPDATSGTEFTSQLFFEDALNDAVFAVAPYSQKGVNGITRNARDSIFGDSNDQLTLKPTGDVTKGLAATFAVGVTA